MSSYFIREFQQKLQKPLPGREAQFKMAHITRRMHVSAPPDARKAGVMVLFFPKNDAWNLIFIERNQNDRDHHGGQIGFPGGKFEPEDEILLNTALREAEEEVGIAQKEINVLGNLTSLYIPVSNFEVFPFVGYLNHPPEYRLQKEEVNAVIEAPLSHFQHPEVVRTTSIRIATHLTLRHVPYFDIGGRVLWGATAMILNELLTIAASPLSG
jgi:8-oxo-dGTP pyrophosphatase MutT (NUDIX family)